MEEKPLFINATRMDPTACRDFLALAWHKNAGFLRVVLLVMGGLAIGYGGLQFIWQGGRPAYGIAMLLMGASAIFLGQWGWLLRLGRYTAAQQQLWKGETLEKTVSFYPQRFTQKSHLGSLSFNYGQITGIRSNKRSLLIEMGNNALLIKKEGFGSQEMAQNFVKFIYKEIKRR